MAAFTESEIENLSLDELRGLGFYYIPGPSIAPDVEAVQPFLKHRLHMASNRKNAQVLAR
jgi:hypothetical protein